MPVALGVKLAYVFNGDFHSIFFTQERIGMNGKLFKFYKFRTMVPNADEILEKILKEDKKLAKEYKLNKKLENDPRITKAGDFLRRLSLDELPQVINILKGDMAVIGNRPYLPREIPDMGEFYDVIVSTKPGLTGYWQVRGRNDVSFKTRLELEKYYSENYSFKLDIQIFFKTFAVVLIGRGAK
jgi:undecaprenyl-phosphate galactose phosphotransferase